MRLKGFNPKHKTTGNWEILELGQWCFPGKSLRTCYLTPRSNNIMQPEKAVFICVAICIYTHIYVTTTKEKEAMNMRKQGGA